MILFYFCCMLFVFSGILCEGMSLYNILLTNYVELMSRIMQHENLPVFASLS